MPFGFHPHDCSGDERNRRSGPCGATVFSLWNAASKVERRGRLRAFDSGLSCRAYARVQRYIFEVSSRGGRLSDTCIYTCRLSSHSFHLFNRIILINSNPPCFNSD